MVANESILTRENKLIFTNVLLIQSWTRKRAIYGQLLVAIYSSMMFLFSIFNWLILIKHVQSMTSVLFCVG